MPQGEHIELHRKRHGYRLDYHERKRKREAREVLTPLPPAGRSSAPCREKVMTRAHGEFAVAHILSAHTLRRAGAQAVAVRSEGHWPQGQNLCKEAACGEGDDEEDHRHAQRAGEQAQGGGREQGQRRAGLPPRA